tara:strand:+ start:31220 stop:31525 length:306 start_codon:yes stop_codon:yes gene_type:complete
MQKLTSERPCSYSPLTFLGDIFYHRPFPTIRIWVTKEIEKGGLQERIKLGEGLAALGPQRVRRIQNFRNAFLFFQRRQKKALPVSVFSIQPRNSGSTIQFC